MACAIFILPNFDQNPKILRLHPASTSCNATSPCMPGVFETDGQTIHYSSPGHACVYIYIYICVCDEYNIYIYIYECVCVRVCVGLRTCIDK